MSLLEPFEVALVLVSLAVEGAVAVAVAVAVLLGATVLVLVTVLVRVRVRVVILVEGVVRVFMDLGSSVKALAFRPIFRDRAEDEDASRLRFARSPRRAGTIRSPLKAGKANPGGRGGGGGVARARLVCGAAPGLHDRCGRPHREPAALPIADRRGAGPRHCRDA